MRQCLRMVVLLTVLNAQAEETRTGCLLARTDRMQQKTRSIGILYQSKGSPGTSYCLLLVLQEELQRHPGCSVVVGGAAGGTLAA